MRAVKVGESAIRKSLQEQIWMGYFIEDVGLIFACADHDDEVEEDERTDDDDESESSRTTPPHSQFYIPDI